MIIIKNKMLYCWIVVYVMVCTFITMQYFSSGVALVIDEYAIDNLLVGHQKMLFNNNLFFAVLIFVSRKNYLSSEYLVRGKNLLMRNIFFDGLLISAIYISMTFMLLSGLSLIVKYSIFINLAPYVVKVLAFCIITYFAYSLLYIMSKNHLLSILLVALANTFLLLLISYMEWYGVGNGYHLNYWNNPIFSSIFSAVMLLAIALIQRKKDFL